MENENNSFLKGLVDGLPICFGYLSVAFAFGIFAVQKGFSVLEAIMISMTNVTSAGQLAAIPIIAAGESLASLAVSQFFINLRYALMSLTLSQKLGKSVRLIDRFLIAFVNTDEVFAVASGQRGNVGKRYLYGLILTPYIGWSVGTAIGAFAGDILPSIVVSSLGIAIYGMFIAIVVPVCKKEKPTAFCALGAVMLSCIFKYVPMLKSIPSGFVIIICAVTVSVICAFFAPIAKEE